MRLPHGRSAGLSPPPSVLFTSLEALYSERERMTPAGIRILVIMCPQVRTCGLLIFVPRAQDRGATLPISGHYDAHTWPLACDRTTSRGASEQVTHEPEEPAGTARQRGQHGRAAP